MCVESGDFSPLGRMSIRDSIYISVCQKLKQQEQIERRKQEFELEFQMHDNIMGVLMDLRKIQLDKLSFETQQKKAMYFYALPSMEKQKKPDNVVGQSRGARKLKHRQD